MEINSIPEFQTSVIIAYSTKGHHDPGSFLAELEKEYGVTADIDDVRQCYRRNVPQGKEGMISLRCKPGKGAYPMTEVDVDNTKVCARSDRG